MSSLGGPSLSAFILVGWVTVPVMFPSALWVLIALTIFFFFTKFTETIVVEKGQLPSLYQCYYKAFYCFKKKRLEKDDFVPYVSSQCAEVVMSTRTMYDFDELVNTCFKPSPLSNASEEVRSVNPNTSPFLRLRTAQAEVLRSKNPLTFADKPRKGRPTLAATMAADAAAAATTSTSSQADASITGSDFIDSLLMSRQIVPVSDDTVSEVESLNIMSDSTYKDMSYGFYHVPSFKMDFSALTFAYFPLSVWKARLDRVDLTILRSVNRKTPLYYSSRITNASRTASGDVEVACVNDISARLFDLLDAEQCRIQCIGKDDMATTLIASLTHYYVFPATNTPSVVENIEDRAQWEAAIRSVLSATASQATPERMAKKLDVELTCDAVSRWANISGNLHPRHLGSTWARMFGESGNTFDGMFASTLVMGALERLVDEDVLTGPFRMTLALEVDASLQAPVNLETRIFSPIDIKDDVVVAEYPHVKERELRIARAERRVSEGDAKEVDPALRLPTIAEKLFPRDWSKAIAVDMVATDGDVRVTYAHGALFYGCTPVPSLLAENIDVIEEEGCEPVPLMEITPAAVMKDTETTVEAQTVHEAVSEAQDEVLVENTDEEIVSSIF